MVSITQVVTILSIADGINLVTRHQSHYQREGERRDQHREHHRQHRIVLVKVRKQPLTKITNCDGRTKAPISSGGNAQDCVAGTVTPSHCKPDGLRKTRTGERPGTIEVEALFVAGGNWLSKFRRRILQKRSARPGITSSRFVKVFFFGPLAACSLMICVTVRLTPLLPLTGGSAQSMNPLLLVTGLAKTRDTKNNVSRDQCRNKEQTNDHRLRKRHECGNLVGLDISSYRYAINIQAKLWSAATASRFPIAIARQAGWNKTRSEGNDALSILNAGPAIRQMISFLRT